MKYFLHSVLSFVVQFCTLEASLQDDEALNVLLSPPFPHRFSINHISKKHE